jgi:excisionase family DNA binding protein
MMTGPDPVTTQVVGPGPAVVQAAVDRLDQHPARPGPDPQQLPETVAAVAALRGYIDATARHAPGQAGPARTALATLDRHTSDLLPLATVAARLHIGEDLARRLVATGRLPAVRLGYRTVRVPAAALSRLATAAEAQVA